MKGLVFREFLELVEKEHGYETVDEIIESSNLESKGIYTTVGTYNHSELFQLAGKLSDRTGITMDELFRKFGIYAFNVFSKAYPDMINIYSNSFEFLERIEDTIHVQVLKLYENAELPKFEFEHVSDDKLIMIYKSSRKMGDFAEGLIIGCLNHFGTKADVLKEIINDEKTEAKFTITKK